jgi:hypothetical protein
VFNVAYVRINPDEHLLAATYAIDNYEVEDRPVTFLMQGGRVFVVPKSVKSYADLQDFVLFDYQEQTKKFFPVIRRVGILGYFTHSLFRGIFELFHMEIDQRVTEKYNSADEDDST